MGVVYPAIKQSGKDGIRKEGSGGPDTAVRLRSFDAGCFSKSWMFFEEPDVFEEFEEEDG